MMNSWGLYIFRSILLLALAFPLASIATEIRVSVDRNPVNSDESFQITFTANDTPDGNPDFSPLEEDFEILNQSHSSNSSWINGKTSKSIQWTLNVMARQAGNRIIPAIRFGNDMSPASSVKVLPGQAKKDVNTDDELFLEVETTPNDPYVQAQVLYTMRLYVRVGIAQASLNEPEIADAVVEKLGEDSKFVTQLNGMEYSVIERRYAIFPQKSGQLTIKPLALTAEVVTGNRSNFNGFFNSQVTQTRRVKSRAITLNVKPAINGHAGHWLASDELVLKQDWSGDNQQIKVGEPLTRTLSVVAKGTTVGQLPELNNAKADEQLKTYPDQPVLQEQKNSSGVVASREEKIALILSRPGSYQLPAIKIPWFNTKTRKMETAIIPETTITAVGAPGMQAQSRLPTLAEPQPATTRTAPEIPALTSEPHQPAANTNLWFWIALGLGLGWLLTVLYFFNKNRIPDSAPKDIKTPDKRDNSEKILRDACAANNSQAAKQALITWGRQQFNAASLGAIAEQCDARLRDEILVLNEVLYGKHSTTEWQGKRLLQAFLENKARTKMVANNKEPVLEPLHRL